MLCININSQAGYGSLNFSAQILTKSDNFCFPLKIPLCWQKTEGFIHFFYANRLFSRLAGSQCQTDTRDTEGVKPGTGIPGPAESEEHDNPSVMQYCTPTVP